MQDTSDDWRRQLMIGLGAVVAVALVVGGVVSVVALGAAKFVGVGSDRPAAASAEPSVHIPPESDAAPPAEEQPAEEQPAEEQAAEGDPADTKPAKAKRGKDAKNDRKKKADKRDGKRRTGPITLSARPQRAAAFQRVRLVGRYPGANGTTLVVQRDEGGWARFPTSATVRHGRFATWVQSGHKGVNRFRVVDRSTGRHSAPVTVRIR